MLSRLPYFFAVLMLASLAEAGTNNYAWKGSGFITLGPDPVAERVEKLRELRHQRPEYLGVVVDELLELVASLHKRIRALEPVGGPQ